MWAGIEEGSDVVAVAANDQNGLVANDVLEEIAGIGNLLFPAGHLPDAGPQAFHLEVKELLRRVAGTGNDHHAGGLAQCESVVGHGHQFRPSLIMGSGRWLRRRQTRPSGGQNNETNRLMPTGVTGVRRFVSLF